MKAFLVVACAFFVCVCAATPDTKNTSLSNSDSEIKIYKRLIPADVLRGKDTLTHIFMFDKCLPSL